MRSRAGSSKSTLTTSSDDSDVIDLSLDGAKVKWFNSREMSTYHFKLKCMAFCSNLLNISLFFCSLWHHQRDITRGWECVQQCFMEAGCCPQGRQTIWQQTWPIRGQTKVIKGGSETFQNLVLNMFIFRLQVHFIGSLCVFSFTHGA